MKIKSSILIILGALLTIFAFDACLYKAGNRQPDINLEAKSNVNVFFIRKEAQRIDTNMYNNNFLNSELVNYPASFFSIEDTINKVKYVLESWIGNDSLLARGYALNLNSIYDYKKSMWIKNRDSFKVKYKINFVTFMQNFLKKVVNNNKNVTDTILYEYNKGNIEFNM